MRKNRFLLAIISYSIVLLMLAVGNSFWFSANTQASAQPAPTATGIPNAVKEDDVTTTPDLPTPGQTVPDKNEQKQPEEKPEDSKQNEGTSEVVDAWELLQAETTKEWREIIGERCIVLPKPEQAEGYDKIQITLSDMPVEHSIALQITGCEYSEYSYDAVERIADKKYFVSVPQLPKQEEITEEETVLTGEAEVEEIETPADPLREMMQLCSLQEDGSYQLYVELLLDKTYVYNVYETETHYFIALLDAKTVYDRIVVLDAGHGGWDTGTPSYDGKFLEKDINLQVLLYLEELLKPEDIKVYTTRTTDRNIGHSDRIMLANSLDADFFVSIHCNNAYQNPEAHGTEVLYTQYQNSVEGMNSKKFAKLCLEELSTALQLNNRGLFARGDDLTVLQKAEVPAALVELAFMSNAADMEVLKTEAAQRAAAEALYKAIMRGYEER